MKIRSGFVSNSSSSSFMIMTTEENHERILKELHPYVKAVIEAMNPEKSKFRGIDVIALGTLSIMDSDFADCLDIDYEGEIPKDKYDEEMNANSAFDKYCDEIKKNKDDTFIFGIDE